MKACISPVNMQPKQEYLLISIREQMYSIFFTAPVLLHSYSNWIQTARLVGLSSLPVIVSFQLDAEAATAVLIQRRLQLTVQEISIASARSNAAVILIRVVRVI